MLGKFASNSRRANRGVNRRSLNVFRPASIEKLWLSAVSSGFFSSKGNGCAAMARQAIWGEQHSEFLASQEDGLIFQPTHGASDSVLENGIARVKGIGARTQSTPKKYPRMENEFRETLTRPEPSSSSFFRPSPWRALRPLREFRSVPCLTAFTSQQSLALSGATFYLTGF